MQKKIYTNIINFSDLKFITVPINKVANGLKLR